MTYHFSANCQPVLTLRLRPSWARTMRKIAASLLLPLALAAASPAQAATAPGAISGSFGVSESGAATYSIPIAVPPGTGGIEPKLSLAYNSQGGNGLLGMGWSLGGLSVIHRCPKTVAQDGVLGGVNYDANDRFCLDGQRLVAINGTYGADATEYRTEMESFSRIVSYGSQGSGPAYWKVWTKSGQIIEFGNTDDSRIEAQGKTEAMLWSLNKLSDTVGNYFTVRYIEDNANGQFYADRIDYTGNDSVGLVPYNSVRFVYEARPDVMSSYQAGSLSRDTVRLKNVRTFVGDSTQVRDYQLSYGISAATNRTRLTSLAVCDSGAACLPTTNFAWQEGGSGGPQQYVMTSGFNSGPGYANADTRAFVDVNGDGKADFCRLEGGSGNYNIYCTTNLGSSGPQQNIVTSGFGGGPGYDNAGTRAYVDVNGDGKADFCRLEGGSGNYNIYCTTNLGSGGPQQNIVTSGFNGGPGYANAGTRAFVDVNGDGKADFCRLEGGSGNYNIYCTTNLGSGGPQQNIVTSGFNSGPGYDNAGTRAFVDVNGDGKADFCRLEGPNYSGGDYYLQCAINLGSGGPQQYVVTSGFNSGPGYANAGTRAYVDVNGDGKADFCRLEGGSGNYNIYCTTNLGSGGTQQNIVTSGFNSGPGYDNTGTRAFVDVNGDGKADFCRLEGPGSDAYYMMCSHLDGAPGGNPDILVSIYIGLGATTTLTYKPLTDPSVYTKGAGAIYPVQDVQAPMYVVSETATDDGIGGQSRTAYRYAGARAHLQGRGFLGFAALEQTDLQTGIVTRTDYSQSFPNIGQPTRMTRTTSGGAELARVDNTLASKTLNGGKTYFPFVSYSKEQGIDLNGIVLPTSETWSTYDDWGNLSQAISQTSDGFRKQTDNTYTNDATKWFLGWLARASVTSTANGVTQTRVSAFEYDATTGLLNKEIIEPDAVNAQFQLITAYAYDAFGNRKSATVSSPATGTAAIAARTTTTTYDARGQFPATTANALGHAETKTFDARFGTVKTLTGPNGLTTTWEYDGFGRKTRESRADGTQTIWLYELCDAACSTGVYRMTTQATGAPASVVYFDQLNRDIRIASQGFDGRWIYKDTVYDGQGRVQKVSRPYFFGQPAYWVSSEYDELGRLLKVFEPDDPVNPALSVAYNGLTVSRTNRKGQTTSEVKNSQGQKLSVADAMGNVTTYAYDPFGNLTRTTDPVGNQIVSLYDLRGRKTQTTDPDLGLWKYEYNPLGELVKQTDAKTQVSTYLYDLLGRMTKRTEPGLASDWIYDTSPTSGKGKLYQAKTSAGYIRTHYYDTLGRASSTMSNLGAGNPLLNQATSYDALGHVLTLTYPSGFSVKHVYNALGYLAEVRKASDNTLYWRADAMDAEGHLTKETYGNGIVTERSHAADTGRLQNITANTAGGQQIQGQAYLYDTIGNVAIYADGPGSQLEIRGGYDPLNRLTQIDSTINGVASSQTLAYNVLGNITSKTAVGSYTYGDLLHKHAVTQAGANAYSYDANGNLIGGGGRSVTWTAWNMPASIIQGGVTTSWLYTPEHDRYKLTDSGRTTWYLNPSVHQGGHYERTQYISGTIEHRHTIYGGGRPIGEVLSFEVPSGTVPAAQTRYFHSDAQGSITAVTDSAGTVLTRFRYDPWGKQTLVSGSNTGISQTRQGHTAHEMLDGGLTHMNGRLYDPVLSRFVSADPVIDNPFDLQSLNRYSYVNNNPFGFTDPSGFMKWTKFRDKILKPVVAIVVAWYLGPIAFNAILPSAVGAAGATGLGMQASVWAGSAIAGAASGAIVGGITGGIYNGPQGVLQGAKYGAIGGAITGPVVAAYNGIDGYGGSPWGAERVVANALAGGLSSAARGGDFAEGFRNSAYTSGAAWAFTSVVGWAADSKQGEGLASPNGRYEPNPDGTIPESARWTNVSGFNKELILDESGRPVFWANLGNQGGFISNIVNALPGGRATSQFHDTPLNPGGALGGVATNPLINWGTMLPAAGLTYGALLNTVPYVDHAIIYGKAR